MLTTSASIIIITPGNMWMYDKKDLRIQIILYGLYLGYAISLIMKNILLLIIPYFAFIFN